jgi:hypothetical protein
VEILKYWLLPMWSKSAVCGVASSNVHSLLDSFINFLPDFFDLVFESGYPFIDLVNPMHKLGPTCTFYFSYSCTYLVIPFKVLRIKAVKLSNVSQHSGSGNILSQNKLGPAQLLLERQHIFHDGRQKYDECVSGDVMKSSVARP